jgi:hypothetical protein
VAAAAALVASSATVLPAHALGAGNTAYCSGNMTLTFTPALTALPTAGRSFSLSGGGSCIGLGSGPVSWMSSSNLQGADTTCEDIVATGLGTITLPSGQTPVNITVVGATAAESWTFMDNGGSNSLQATGAFAWTNLSEIQSCLGSGTTTVSLTGSFVVLT